MGEVSDLYEATLEWLYALDARAGMDFSPGRLEPVLSLLNEPQTAFPSIHIAGTNGKGSTAAMLHSVYTAAGYRCGLYTSPHLMSFRERIRVGDDMITETDVVTYNQRIKAAIEAAAVELTFFEITTAMAFLEFKARQVDLAVVEVGLGGRLDATNIVDSVATAITSIGKDHCAYLGEDVADIAKEKAGIIKSGVPLVTGPLPHRARAVVRQAAKYRNARWLRYGRDFGPQSARVAPSLLGPHQSTNAGIAAAIVRQLQERFPVSREALEKGVSTVRWPGRLEVVDSSPTTVLDAAHNPDAAQSLLDALPSLGLQQPRILVFGALADKDWPEMLCRLLPAFDEVVFVPIANKRAEDPAEFAAVADGLKPFAVADSARQGIGMAKSLAGETGSVVVTGSIFLVAELYEESGGRGEPFDRKIADL